MDLEQVITDSVNDATFGIEETPAETPEAAPVEASADLDAPAADEVPPDAGAESPSLDEPAQESIATPSPAQQNAPQDDFERLAGIPQMGVAGRENRIPYSRVKKITEKAVSEVAEAALGRKLAPGEKAIDVVKQHVAQLPQLIEANRDYESRLNVVGEFENLMASQPQQFLQRLATLPAYKEFFEFVEQAYAAFEAGGGSFSGQAAAQPTVGQQSGTQGATQMPTDGTDPMPEPDETLPDGSRQYSMAGVKQLLDWNSRQVAKQVRQDVTSELTSQFDKRLKPMESMQNEWQARQKMEATLPLVRMKIAEARTWPLFTENEQEIVALLEKNPNISLDSAYREVVFPKILADRSKMKETVIQELQSAPMATSAVGGTATRPQTQNAGPKSLEDIIRESVATLKR